MGHVVNLLRDLRSGLFTLTLAQLRFLRHSRGRYAVVVAVGDAFALGMALVARAPVVYIGTAKSVRVAPYGRFEERLLRRARMVFVRDEPTAARLRKHGIAAEAPGNTIVDIFAGGEDSAIDTAANGFTSVVGLLPGSRAHAYNDAVFLASVFAEAARGRSGLGALLSIAPNIDSRRMAASLRESGWDVRETQSSSVPFEASDGVRTLLRAWSGALGPLLRRSTLVLGQAGTANEAAAAAGLPIIAFDRGIDREHAWYRRRQALLLGEALIMLSDDRMNAVARLGELLDDPARRERLGAIGRERMGRPGGTRAIARRIANMLVETD